LLVYRAENLPIDIATAIFSSIFVFAARYTQNSFAEVTSLVDSSIISSDTALKVVYIRIEREDIAAWQKNIY
jgi:hypothetical protein